MWILLRFWLPLALVTIYAAARGGMPERVASGMLLSAAIASELVRPHGSHRFAVTRTGILLVDLVLMGGLIWLALRAARYWPIPLAGLQATTLLGHLGRAENSHLWQLSYYLMVTIPVFPGLLILAAGIWRHQRRLRQFGTDPSWKP